MGLKEFALKKRKASSSKFEASLNEASLSAKEKSKLMLSLRQNERGKMLDAFVKKV